MRATDMLKIQTATTWGEVKGSDRSEINPKQLGHMEHGVILSGAIHPSSATMKPKVSSIGLVKEIPASIPYLS